MIAAGIITAPRPVPTLERSLRSFRNAGWLDAKIFAEPGVDRVIMDGVHWVANDQRKGNFKNWVHALRSTMEGNNYDWIMICEDDIKWAYEAAPILCQDLINWKGDGRTGMISLYLPIRVSKIIEKQHGGPLRYGWYQANLGKQSWGAQCLVFHRTWALALLEDKVLKAFIGDPRWDKNVDILIADVIGRQGKDIMYRVPCLVDHTFGDGNSSLGYRPDRPELKTRYFKEVQ